jgi:hypothetical protein
MHLLLALGRRGGEGMGGLIAIVFETRPKNHNLRKKLIKNKYITARE